MKLRLALAAAAVALTATPLAAAEDKPQLYEGFTLIDPEVATETPAAWIVVRDGRIEQVGSGRPPRGNYERHDMSGLFGLPGLIDAHAHITVGPFAVSLEDGKPRVEMISGDKFTRFNALVALAFGITSVRNPGGSTEAAAHYDTMLARGEWLGPEALHAGAIIEPLPFAGESFAHPTSAHAWDAEAARQAHAGMTYFKLYKDLTADELAQGVQAAKAHGLIPIAHLEKVSWTQAAELGVEQLEHAQPFSPDLLPADRRAGFAIDPYARYMYRWFELAELNGPEITEMIRMLRERQTVITLTLIADKVVFDVKNLNAIFPEDERVFYQPESLTSALANYEAIAAAWTDEDAARAAAAWPKVLKFAKLLHDSGVRMMIGTDSEGGTPFYPRELGYYADAGIPAMEVLRMATSGNAALMGLTDTGRIAPGLEADVVFLRADPARDVRNVREVELTLSNGHPYRPADLVAQAQEFAN